MVGISSVTKNIKTVGAKVLKPTQKTITEVTNKTSNTWEQLAFDGAYDSSVYDALRAHMYPQIFTNYSVTKGIVKGKSNYIFDKLKNLNEQFSKPGKEIRLAPISNNSVRGRNIVTLPKSAFNQVKENGIERIIDLRAEVNSSLNGRLKIQNGKTYVDGLEYVHVPLNYNNGLDDLQAIKAFPNFFEAMDKGNVYIGCNMGSHRTDFAVALNYALNTYTKEAPPILYLKPNDVTSGIQRVYKKIQKMSPEELEALGLNQDFMKRLPKNKEELNKRLINITNATKEIN